MDNPERLRQIERLYHDALGRDKGERVSFLRETCAGDEALHREVESLLACSTEAEGFIESPAMELAARELAEAGLTGAGAHDRAASWLPSTIGRYRILRLLGEGGMGAVYEAEQEHPRRVVALKVVKPGWINPETLRRFEQESQVLGRLQHPGIAQIYEAGTAGTALGRQPYFAMECIRGQSLREYAEAHRLTTRQRLELTVKICDAVQHAHQRGLIHRDLKPTNILVDETGQPKILDFGIARVTDSDTQATLQTNEGQMLGTLAYMSPEQLLGDPLDLDTRSDIYALGVIAYELLAGRLPYTLTGKPLEAMRIVREENPHPLSSVNRLYRGDLETIVTKALEKDKTRRYASAADLGADIERYLRDEPITARPPSATYHFKKFARRHRALVAGVAAVFVVLVGGIAATTWQAARATQASQAARVQTRTAQAVQAFLTDIFMANSLDRPDPVRARQTTARELLDAGARKIDGALNDGPEAKLAVLELLANLYSELGLREEAFGLSRKRIALAKSVYGPDHPEVARAIVELVDSSSESSSVNELPALLKEAESILDHNRDFTSKTRAGYDMAAAGVYLQSDLAKSAEFVDHAIRLFRASPQYGHLADALYMSGIIEVRRKRYSEAIQPLTEAKGIIESGQDVDRISLPRIYTYLAQSHESLLEIPAAEHNYRVALDMARSLKGEDHEDVLQIKSRLGSFLVLASRPQEGLKLGQEAVEMAVRTKGQDDLFHTQGVRVGYGWSLLRFGRVEEGLVPIYQAVEVRRRGKRARTADFAGSLVKLADGETELGHYSQATALLEESFGIHAATGGTLASGLLDEALLARVRLLLATKQVKEAEPVFRSIPAEADPRRPTFHSFDVSIEKAAVDLAKGQYEDAIRDAREFRTRLESSTQRLHLKRFEALADLEEGKGLLLTGHADQAFPLLERAVQLALEVYDPERSPALADAQIALAGCELKLGRRGQALGLFAQAKAIHSLHKELGEQHRRPLRDLAAELGVRH